MNNYCANLADNVVIAVVVGDYEWVVANLDGNWHDLGGDPLTVGVGYTYDPDLDEFIAPAAPLNENEAPLKETSNETE